MPRLLTIKVAREEDLRAQIGQGGHYFDLVYFSRVRAFQVVADTPICRFKEELAEEFGIPVQSLRLWLWVQRQNKAFHPCRPLSPNEEKESVGLKSLKDSNAGELDLLLEVLHPFPEWNLISKDHILVFLKLYDPGQMQIRYVGKLIVKASSRPLDILPKLRTLAGLHAYEKIELYEEIKFKPNLMRERIDINATFTCSMIENGDIICYQKMPKYEDKYPDVVLFFQRVLDHKDAQMKIQALEEEVVMLKHQARRGNEAEKECDELKQDRDNALRQVDELRDQSRHIILEFSLDDLKQATENFSDVCKIGDTEYGHIYKGIIRKTTVAIKLSCSQSLFQQEVYILRESSHPNIVAIIGVCSEACALMYESLPNGNLEDCIVSTDNSPPLLWRKRAQIIGDICCMLLFLHAHKPSALVHGDLRPCNILIDANYRTKLCNFGMSNLFLMSGTFPPNLTARLPYMDPEFLTTGELTPLSDIYSLGIIILRLLTGMPPLSIAKKVAAALGE